ncbi:MAG: S-layer homology domain-containing protein [Clostridia bacterium]|nr:S-layer homology domain-containing protein [Clostridia bacterium]
MKKIISLLLVLATVVSCFAVTAVTSFAVRASDEGVIPFEDVKGDHWFVDQVTFCYANGIINGMNEYTFGWNGNLTRAQFVTMLANLEGVDTSAYTVDRFTDVKSGHWFYGAVAWAYNKGIVSGMTETAFQPNGVLTRAQLATVMRNYMQGKYTVEINETVLDSFTDKPKTEYWYYDAMVYAVSAELLSGNSNGTLAATGNVTRAQAAVIFMNFMTKYFYADCEHSYAGPDCTNAEACTKCGMVIGLPEGHVLPNEYNCVTSATCLECGAAVAPSGRLHDFKEATCSAPRTCKLCGVTRGEAKGHSFKAATCTAPKTCTSCGMTQGNALGHSYSGNSCSRCGIDLPYTRVVYNMKRKGSFDVVENTYTYYTTDEYGVIGIVYDATTGELGFFYGGLYESGAYDVTAVVLPKTGTTCKYEYMYYSSTDDPVFYGTGYIDAKTFNEDTLPGFSSYEGGSNNVTTARKNAGFEIHLALKSINILLKELGDANIAEFGFNNYK